MGKIRLQKFIANCGVTSRRKAEDLIVNGKVKVNGVIITELGTKINSTKDIVTVNNDIIMENNNFIYIKLYKPEGYITTVKDQFARKTVIDLISINERIYPIGRLDYNTSGLLLLTNDGDFANKLMHPKFHINKTYEAEVKGLIKKETIEKLKTGVTIDGYKTAPAMVKVIGNSHNKSNVQIIIHEGKNRQVRKMFNAVGHNVISLKRTAFGKINLDNLLPGKWEYLSNDEINSFG
ncbi:pseudouridine synthase [Sedimentibacter sp. MB31-C6]|uniref:pseudouridine synthase n=1 Tax=Sedimentibacter sp. MB31-C6 TaxID=3109366 RepID=UPI002DDD33D9|nr:pseudouridine synthase [Sedimentibacter sp. MB36-C1]WSI04204.1 pseudouridine synthase [Sedimentibacter sp. MB36-C1]